VEYKSNIAVASNIYTRKNPDINKDPEFVHNCRGREALLSLKNQLTPNGAVRITRMQEEEYRQDKGCIKARDGQMTHGAVMRGDAIVWECRCEYEECEDFSQCMPNPIVRPLDDSSAAWDWTNSYELRYERLGTIEHILRAPAEIEPEIEEEPIPEEFAETPPIISGEYVKLEKHFGAIIEADINSHILVDAGPGTGKTHTVIERLSHIINSGEVDLGQVLVLCYTNAVRDVILRRLAERGLSSEARQLVICTLDSLAWNNLSQKTDEDLFALGFNGCIQRFNNMFDAEEWSGFQYVIIDELQDLVNERAKMTLNILGALRCGYLLLGDKCQAIYDYDCVGREKINSVSFYNSLGELLPDDAAKYELTGNRRQTKELADLSDGFRSALISLSATEANKYFVTEIKAMPSELFSPNIFSEPTDGTTAILTRSNGEAEWVSAQLHGKKIPHTLLRSVTQRTSLHRWLADMFWDYRESRISRDDFIERYSIRVGGGEGTAESAYCAILASLSAERDGYFELEKLREALIRGQELSPLLLNTPESLTVSTIHKAKGREYDRVFLFDCLRPSQTNAEEARVWYVGATRPRSELYRLRKGRWPLFKSSSGRWIKQGPAKYHRKTFCDRITVGLPEDVEQAGFIFGNLGQAIDTQAYIASQIKADDRLELRLAGSVYHIQHDGHVIGRLSDSAQMSISSSVREFYKSSGIPSHLTEIYVNNIITVVPSKFPSRADSMFKESKFWLGIELTGFAKADWS
jgi:hypothetical protein